MKPPTVRTVILALPDAREDAERRARGVSIEDWLAAPPAPAKGDECDGKEAGCPALRCSWHLGRVGEAAGYSCDAQIARLPEEERTFDLIGRVLGVTFQRAEQIEKSGRHKIKSQPKEVLQRLRVRGRHT